MVILLFFTVGFSTIVDYYLWLFDFLFVRAAKIGASLIVAKFDMQLMLGDGWENVYLAVLFHLPC